MNKKKLSVVMAGAMLASSVAPVLAATESEVDSSKLGSLVVNVYDKVTSKLYSDTSGSKAKGIFGSDINSDIVNESVYSIKIGEKDIAKAELATDLTVDANKVALKNALQEAFKELKPGQEVKIYSSYEERLGYVINKKAQIPTYTTSEIDALNATTIFNGMTDTGSNTELLEKAARVSVDSGAHTLTFNFKKEAKKIKGAKLAEITDTTKVEVMQLVVKEGDTEKDFNTAILNDGTEVETKSLTTAQVGEVIGFKTADVEYISIANPELVETIKVTGKENNFKTEDLYDGLMLTTEGHNLLSLVKKARTKTNYTVDFEDIAGYDIGEKDKNIKLHPNADGEYGFSITIKDAFGSSTVYTVKGAEKATNTLASWLNDELAKVDILAGDNRYETAVSVAREQLKLPEGYLGENDDDNDATVSNIVLVNGRSLVDGLAAAPLAASLTANEDNDIAPVLLTEADELPKATREFLKELLAKKVIGNVNTTIHLVGGTSVLSRSLEKELRSYGFKIERYNGANREETSLKVAEAIEDNSGDDTNRFIVGANGEADAMSIAPVASTNKTPIIVAKKGGISYDALDELDAKEVTVVGGELSVSKEDYEAIEEAVGKTGAVERVSGENRQATNAAIIKKYYKDGTSGIVNGLDVDSIIVSKDGKGNNDELIDALTVANLAVQKKAPIVLAKSSLSDAQIDALNLRGKSSESLYQVGIGVERSVMETLASHLGLLNK